MKQPKIKRYRMPISRTFPATHPRKGEETYFHYKVLTALYPHHTYFPTECCNCGKLSWSHLACGGYQIADTGDYADMYCDSCGSLELESIEDSELTYYKSNENVWPKLHTIRSNYQLWKKRMEEVQQGKAVIELYYWSGNPYRSKQVVFAILDRHSGCGVQKIDLSKLEFHHYPYIVHEDDTCTHCKIEQVSKNDGLSLEDFKSWFKGYDLSEPMAIVHFTNFRY